MLGEILSKLGDSAAMFWQSLSDYERRAMTYLGLYVAVSLVMMLGKKAEGQRRQVLHDELRKLLEERDARSA